MEAPNGPTKIKRVHDPTQPSTAPKYWPSGFGWLQYYRQGFCMTRDHPICTTFAPGKKGTVWTTIENQNSWRKSTSVEWRIKQNGDVHRPTGKAVRFNVFNVTMDILKVEMYLKM